MPCSTRGDAEYNLLFTVAEEVYDGCIVTTVGVHYTFTPPVKVPGTCYKDPDGTYVGTAGQLTISGAPDELQITGTLDGRAVNLRGSISRNVLNAGHHSWDRGDELWARFEPPGTLTGDREWYCWYYCGDPPPDPSYVSTHFALTRVATGD